MDKTIIVAVLLLVVAGLIWLLFKEFEREHHRQELARKNMSFIESINLTGLPIISFENNGHTVNMVLDTGSNVCLINAESIKDLKYEIAETHQGVIGVSGEIGEGGSTVYLPLTYKSTTFDFECCVSDMSGTMNSIKQEYGVTIHGILGTGFFIKYKYILDFSSMVAYSLSNLN